MNTASHRRRLALSKFQTRRYWQNKLIFVQNFLSRKKIILIFIF